jgi:hypothetical protein
MRLASCLLLLALASACSTTPGPVMGAPPPATPAPLPPAPPAPSATAASPADSRKGGSDGVVPAPVAKNEGVKGGEVVAGQMSEEAAQAKRLFDSEKWGEALPALRRVVAGETGDDLGNRQVSAYRMAIVLYRLGRHDESLTAFLPLASDANHLKHAETILWLAKLMDQPAPVGDKAGRAIKENYRDQDVARFNNAAQRELYEKLRKLMGH